MSKRIILGYWICNLALVLLLLFAGSGCSRESRKARHLQRANQYFQATDLPKAEIEYLLVLRLDSSNPIAVSRLGSIYYDQGNPSKAFAFLQTAKELTPTDIQARKKLALLYLAGGSFQEAKQETEYLLGAAPADPEALILAAEIARNSNDVQQATQRLQSLQNAYGKTAGFQVAQGILLLRENKVSEAEAAFKSALSIDPQFPDAHSALAHVYLAQNDLKRAEEFLKTAASLSPIRSSRQLEYIDFKLRTGDLADARNLLDHLLQQAPDYLPALARQTELAVVENRLTDASAHLQRILSRDPQNYEGLMLQARLLLAHGQGDKAISHLQRVAALFSKTPQVPYQLALAFLASDDTTKAIQSLNKARSLDPNFPDATLLLAEIDLRQGDTGSAIALLQPLIQKRPNLVQPYLLLANAYRAQNNIDDVLKTYSRLMELSPRNPEVPTLAGMVYLFQNRTNDARQAFEKSLELAPHYLPALEQVIKLDIAEKHFEAALSRLQKESQKLPKAAEIQILSARIYQAQGETNKAEQALLKSIELAPNYREPYLVLARLYVDKNEYSSAIHNLKELIAKNPKDVGALMLLGTIYNLLKDYAAERQAYEKLLAINPKFGPAVNNLAYLYSEQFNDLQKAFDMARRARELSPFDPNATDTLGWILFKRQQYPWALSLLQESADKLRDQPEVLYHLGMARYVMGHEQAARTAFERALQYPAAFPGRDECTRRLSILNLDPAANDPGTLKNLESQLAEHADDPVALARLAAIYQHGRFYDKARAAYESALRLNPRNIVVLLGLAELYERQFNNPQKAMDLAKNARSIAPDDPNSAHLLGRLALQSGQPADSDWALSLLQEAEQKAPEDPEIAYDLAWAYYSVGRVADAEAALQNALKSSHIFLHEQEARRFLRMLSLAKEPQNAAAASAEIQSALQSDPAYVPALMASACVLERQGKNQSAESAYQTVLKRFPKFVPAHKRLAFLLLDRNPDQAFEHAAKAREFTPEDAESTKLAGIAAFKRRDFSRSTQLLGQYARSFPDDAETYYYLGMAHYRLDHKSESKQAFRQALALNIPARLADEVNRLLLELN